MSVDLEISRILGGGLAAADSRGRRQVLPRDLPAADLDRLATLTMHFLRSRAASPSPIPGWQMVSAAAAGVLPWWAGALGILDDENQRRRLRLLRMAIYDLLEERQLVVKHPGQGNPVHVAPESADRVPDYEATDHEGAGYGSSELNALVERAAMHHVVTTYESAGWQSDDVSSLRVGWDVTFRRGHEERHVEVKGCSGPRPSFMLGKNEYSCSQRDGNWVLARTFHDTAGRAGSGLVVRFGASARLGGVWKRPACRVG